MRIKKIFKKLIRQYIPFNERLKATWRARTLALAFSSGHNNVRYEGEFLIARDFHNYLAKLKPAETEKLMADLNNNLDLDSQAEVARILERQDYIYHHNLLEQANFFTSEEFSAQKTATEEIGRMRQKLKAFELRNFNPESIFGLSGLRWLPEYILEKLNKGVFLDIGAYDGDSALAFYYAYRPSAIYAFEPENGNFERLRKNNKILGGNVIIPVKAGVSNKSAKAYISRERSCSKLSTDERDERINLIRLDEFASENKLTRVDVVKMDIEGMEMAAVQGASELIKKFKPVLAISIYHNPSDFFEIKLYLEKLVPEYKFMIKKANPFSLALEVMLLGYCE